MGAVDVHAMDVDNMFACVCSHLTAARYDCLFGVKSPCL